MKPRDPRRTLILRLRRNVRVSSKFDVRQVGELDEEQKCRECGYTTVMHHDTTPTMAKKLIAYRSRGSILGVCPGCSRRAARERYPLPEDEVKPV